MRGGRVCATLLVLVLSSACTADSPPAPVEPSVSPSESISAPINLSPRGSVSVGFVGAPATLDPFSPVASDLTRAIVRPLLPSLFRLQPDGSAVPSLASDLSRTGRGVRLTLADLSWSDGRAVTARDVAASIKRARPPSGFAYIDSAEVLSRRALMLTGEVEDWPSALATSAYVLPRGRWDPEVTSGPLQVVSYTPDAELRLRTSPGAPLAFKTWRLRFVDQADTLISALESGDFDVAVIPSSVNLGERLEAQGIGFSSGLGWEWIGLRTSGPVARDALAESADLQLLGESFIRDEGEIAEATWPPGGGSEGASGEPAASAAAADITIANPTGDELLGLMVRAIQLGAQDQGATMSLAEVDARTLYGEWQEAAPVDALLMRSAGAPFLSEVQPKSLGPDLPLFRVETFLAWSETMSDLTVNPTIEGPLWNLERWRRAEGD